MDDTKARFRDLEWVPQLKSIPAISILGLGGIGSHLAMLISRLNVPLYLYDNDIVEDVNLSGQSYPKEHIGIPKISSIQIQIQSFSPGTYTTLNPILVIETTTLPYPKYIFAAFDNMKARRIAFDKWKSTKDRELFVDGRMLAESMEIFFVRKGLEEEYEKYLYKDEDIPDLPCSAKATTHCGAMIASLMITGFTNYLSNKAYKKDVREVPFRLNYDLELFNQNIVYVSDIQTKS